MRNRFDEQLTQLNNNLIEMGGQIEYAISMAVKGLTTQDTVLARKAIEFDTEINQKEKEIESLCLKLLLQQQPIARDLRQISSALKMITDMERIGDQSADISEITIYLAGTPYIRQLDLIPEMAREVIGMLNDALDAFVRKDLGLANEVIVQDDVVDDLFNRVRSDLIDSIRENADNGAQAIDLMMIAKYLERIGDHVVNIAEWVVFSLTGEHKYGNM